MDRKEPEGYGGLCIFLDILLIIDAIIGIVKGEITGQHLLWALIMVLVVSIPLILWMRSRRRK